MGSTLLGLPREIKELIYFDALSHAANKILVSYPICLDLLSHANSLPNFDPFSFFTQCYPRTSKN